MRPLPPFLMALLLLLAALTTGCEGYEPYANYGMSAWANEGTGVLTTWHEYESKNNFMSTTTKNHTYQLVMAPGPKGPFTPLGKTLAGTPPDGLFYMKSAGYALGIRYCGNDATCVERYDLTTGEVVQSASFENEIGDVDCVDLHVQTVVSMRFLLAPSPDGSVLALFRAGHDGGCPSLEDMEVSVSFLDPQTFALLGPPRVLDVPPAAMMEIQTETSCKAPYDANDPACLPTRSLGLGAMAAWTEDNRLMVGFVKAYHQNYGDGYDSVVLWDEATDGGHHLSAVLVTPDESTLIALGPQDDSCFEVATRGDEYAADGTYLAGGDVVELKSFSSDMTFGCD